jgi:capsular polysaccharide biosynthesis protein
MVAFRNFVPAAARRVLRVVHRRLLYGGARIASYALGSALGARAPLRGYYVQLPTKYHISVDGHAGFIARIPNGRVLQDYGIVVTPDHRLAADVSPALGLPPDHHPVLLRMSLPAERTIRGVVAVVTSLAHQRYFHWMFDILPRIHNLRCASIEPDYFVLNTGLSYQRETINWLGVPHTKIISPDLDSHICAAELIVPSLPGPPGTITQRSYDFLRAAFLQPNSTPDKIIYISRKHALTRRVANEDDVIAAIRGFYPQLETVVLESFSVREQMTLFAAARMVIGPHGAGFTNCVFSQPCARLIEFMPSTYRNDCFSQLAELGSLNYTRIATPSLCSLTHDIVVDVREVARVMENP